MSDYRGMTVNERLVSAGLLDAFDAAARGRDKFRMNEILLSVQLSADQAAEAVNTILNDPKKYGFS